MKIYADTIVYILCVPGIETGGPTALHQLASQLEALGVTAKIFYVEIVGYDFDCPVAEGYRKYHLDWTKEVIDEPQNILVVFEAMPQGIYSFTRIRKVFWWLSVDNYIASLRGQVNRIDTANLARVPLERFFFFGQSIEVTHWCQSEYARQFLICNGVPSEEIFMVEDYLGWEFMDSLSGGELIARQNIAAYNPRKGQETTEKIIAMRPDIDWRPIENMTPDEVKTLLKTAKVYIDFGHHPGKDRIPREAAMSGCVVITGRRGAAGNGVDINIPECFKLADDDIAGIVEKIEQVFTDYPAAYQQQAAYRRRIVTDYARFTDEVAKAVELEPGKIPLWSAVINDGGEGLAIAQALWELNEEFRLKYIVDDDLAGVAQLPDGIYERQGRRYLCLQEQFSVEILSSVDANFLYREGRIKKFFVKESDAAAQKAQNRLLSLRAEDLLLV